MPEPVLIPPFQFLLGATHKIQDDSKDNTEEDERLIKETASIIYGREIKSGEMTPEDAVVRYKKLQAIDSDLTGVDRVVDRLYRDQPNVLAAIGKKKVETEYTVPKKKEEKASLSVLLEGEGEETDPFKSDPFSWVEPARREQRERDSFNAWGIPDKDKTIEELSNEEMTRLLQYKIYRQNEELAREREKEDRRQGALTVDRMFDLAARGAIGVMQTWEFSVDNLIWLVKGSNYLEKKIGTMSNEEIVEAIQRKVKPVGELDEITVHSLADDLSEVVIRTREKEAPKNFNEFMLFTAGWMTPMLVDLIIGSRAAGLLLKTTPALGILKEAVKLPFVGKMIPKVATSAITLSVGAVPAAIGTEDPYEHILQSAWFGVQAGAVGHVASTTLGRLLRSQGMENIVTKMAAKEPKGMKAGVYYVLNTLKKYPRIAEEVGGVMGSYGVGRYLTGTETREEGVALGIMFAAQHALGSHAFRQFFKRGSRSVYTDGTNYFAKNEKDGTYTLIDGAEFQKNGVITPVKELKPDATFTKEIQGEIDKIPITADDYTFKSTPAIEKEILSIFAAPSAEALRFQLMWDARVLQRKYEKHYADLDPLRKEWIDLVIKEQGFTYEQAEITVEASIKARAMKEASKEYHKERIEKVKKHAEASKKQPKDTAEKSEFAEKDDTLSDIMHKAADKDRSQQLAEKYKTDAEIHKQKVEAEKQRKAEERAKKAAERAEAKKATKDKGKEEKVEPKPNLGEIEGNPFSYSEEKVREEYKAAVIPEELVKRFGQSKEELLEKNNIEDMRAQLFVLELIKQGNKPEEITQGFLGERMGKAIEEAGLLKQKIADAQINKLNKTITKHEKENDGQLSPEDYPYKIGEILYSANTEFEVTGFTRSSKTLKIMVHGNKIIDGAKTPSKMALSTVQEHYSTTKPIKVAKTTKKSAVPQDIVPEDLRDRIEYRGLKKSGAGEFYEFVVKVGVSKDSNISILTDVAPDKLPDVLRERYAAKEEEVQANLSKRNQIRDLLIKGKTDEEIIKSMELAPHEERLIWEIKEQIKNETTRIDQSGKKVEIVDTKNIVFMDKVFRLIHKSLDRLFKGDTYSSNLTDLYKNKKFEKHLFLHLIFGNIDGKGNLGATPEGRLGVLEKENELIAKIVKADVTGISLYDLKNPFTRSFDFYRSKVSRGWQGLKEQYDMLKDISKADIKEMAEKSGYSDKVAADIAWVIDARREAVLRKLAAQIVNTKTVPEEVRSEILETVPQTGAKGVDTGVIQPEFSPRERAVLSRLEVILQEIVSSSRQMEMEHNAGTIDYLTVTAKINKLMEDMQHLGADIAEQGIVLSNERKRELDTAISVLEMNKKLYHDGTLKSHLLLGFDPILMASSIKRGIKQLNDAMLDTMLGTRKHEKIDPHDFATELLRVAAYRKTTFYNMEQLVTRLVNNVVAEGIKKQDMGSIIPQVRNVLTQTLMDNQIPFERQRVEDEVRAVLEDKYLPKLSEELKQQDARVISLKQAMSDLDSNMKNAQEERNRLESIKTDLQKLLYRYLTPETAKLQEQISVKEKAYNTLNGKVKELQSQLDKVFDIRIHPEAGRLSREIKQLEKESERTKAELQRLSKQEGELVATSAVRLKLERLNNELSDKREKYKEAGAKIDKANIEGKALYKERYGLEKQITALEAKQSEAVKNGSVLTEEGSIQARLLQEKIISISNRLLEVKNRIRTYDKQGEIRAEAEKLEKYASSVKEEIDNLKSEFDKVKKQQAVTETPKDSKQFAEFETRNAKNNAEIAKNEESFERLKAEQTRLSEEANIEITKQESLRRQHEVENEKAKLDIDKRVEDVVNKMKVDVRVGKEVQKHVEQIIESITPALTETAEVQKKDVNGSSLLTQNHMKPIDKKGLNTLEAVRSAVEKMYGEENNSLSTVYAQGKQFWLMPPSAKELDMLDAVDGRTTAILGIGQFDLLHLHKNLDARFYIEVFPSEGDVFFAINPLNPNKITSVGTASRLKENGMALSLGRVDRSKLGQVIIFVGANETSKNVLRRDDVAQIVEFAIKNKLPIAIQRFDRYGNATRHRYNPTIMKEFANPFEVFRGDFAKFTETIFNVDIASQTPEEQMFYNRVYDEFNSMLDRIVNMRDGKQLEALKEEVKRFREDYGKGLTEDGLKKLEGIESFTAKLDKEIQAITPEERKKFSDVIFNKSLALSGEITKSEKTLTEIHAEQMAKLEFTMKLRQIFNRPISIEISGRGADLNVYNSKNIFDLIDYVIKNKNEIFIESIRILEKQFGIEPEKTASFSNFSKELVESGNLQTLSKYQFSLGKLLEAHLNSLTKQLEYVKSNNIVEDVAALQARIGEAEKSLSDIAGAIERASGEKSKSVEGELRKASAIFEKYERQIRQGKKLSQKGEQLRAENYIKMQQLEKELAEIDMLRSYRKIQELESLLSRTNAEIGVDAAEFTTREQRNPLYIQEVKSSLFLQKAKAIEAEVAAIEQQIVKKKQEISEHTETPNLKMLEVEVQRLSDEYNKLKTEGENIKKAISSSTDQKKLDELYNRQIEIEVRQEQIQDRLMETTPMRQEFADQHKMLDAELAKLQAMKQFVETEYIEYRKNLPSLINKSLETTKNLETLYEKMRLKTKSTSVEDMHELMKKRMEEEGSFGLGVSGAADFENMVKHYKTLRKEQETKLVDLRKRLHGKKIYVAEEGKEESKQALVKQIEEATLKLQAYNTQLAALKVANTEAQISYYEKTGKALRMFVEDLENLFGADNMTDAGMKPEYLALTYLRQLNRVDPLTYVELFKLAQSSKIGYDYKKVLEDVSLKDRQEAYRQVAFVENFMMSKSKQGQPLRDRINVIRKYISGLTLKDKAALRKAEKALFRKTISDEVQEEFYEAQELGFNKPGGDVLKTEARIEKTRDDAEATTFDKVAEKDMADRFADEGIEMAKETKDTKDAERAELEEGGVLYSTIFPFTFRQFRHFFSAKGEKEREILYRSFIDGITVNGGWLDRGIQRLFKLIKKDVGTHPFKHVRAFILAQKGMTPEIQRSIFQMQIDMHNAQLAGIEFRAKFDALGLNKEQQLAVIDYLQSEVMGIRTDLVDPNLALLAKRLIEEAGIKLVEQRMLSEKTFLKKRGMYLHKAYWETTPDFTEWVTEVSLRNRFMGQELMKKKEVVSSKFTPILDPGILVGKSLIMMLNDIAVGGHYSRIIQMGKEIYVSKEDYKLLTDEQKRDLATGYTRVPYKANYGVLKGGWVRNDVYDFAVAMKDAQYIIGRTEPEAYLAQLWKRSVRAFKVGQIAWSPSAQVRNFTTNYLIQIMSGMGVIPLTQIKAMQEMFNREPGAIYEEAFKHNVFKGNFMDVEMIEKFAGFRRPFERLPKNVEDYASSYWEVARMLEDVKKHPLSTISAPVKDLYQFIEQWNKLALYMHAKEKLGMNKLDAAMYARKWGIDYFQVSRFNEWLRWSPVGAPFATFSLKAIPLIAESFAIRPYKALLVLLAPALISQIPYVLNINTRAEEEEWKESTRLMPAWARGLSLPILGSVNNIKLGRKYENGKWLIRYADVTYFSPYSIFKGVPFNFYMANPITNFAYGVISNMDQFRMRHGLSRPEIYKDYEPFTRQAASVINYASKTLLPPTIPYAGRDWDIIQDFLDGRVDAYEQEPTAIKTLARFGFGLRVGVINPEVERTNRLREAKFEANEIRFAIRKQGEELEKGSISREEFNEFRDRHLEYLDAVAEKVKEINKNK